MSTIIKNGTICLEGEHFIADLHIKGEQIYAIGKNLADILPAEELKHTQIIDATGKYVCPGGIDPHTHMDLQQSPKYRACDDFFDGGVAAACGGTTTIIDHMAFGPKGCSLSHQFEEYKKLAERCPIDYSFHGVFQHINEDILNELAELIDKKGFPSYKAYTTYGFPMVEPEILKVLKVSGPHNGLLTVHAENDTITNTLRNELKPEEVLPQAQATTRPNIAESESVNMLISCAHVAGDAPVYIVHLSAHESLEEVKLARSRGQENIFVETCTQYLLLTDDKFKDGGPEEAIKYMMAPPLRKKVDQEALWEGLANGDVQVIATDHCPFTILEKLENVKDFRSCPGGISGVEERMPLIFSEGVMKGKLSLERFVQTTSTNAAKIFGMYPRKGTLQPGSDADIVIIDPTKERTIAKDNLKTTCGYSPYEGFTTQCIINKVFVRGELVAENNNFVGKRNFGKLIPRKREVEYSEIVK